jgi:uncharacterized protein YkwD
LDLHSNNVDRFHRALDRAISRRVVAGFTAGWLTFVGSRFTWAARSDAKKKSDKEKGKRKKRRKRKNDRIPDEVPQQCLADGPWPDGEETAFLALINDYRRSNGLGLLVQNPQLAAAAEFHSQEMAIYNYFDHVSPFGVTSEQNIRNHGYTNYIAFAENITANYETAAAAFASWQVSASHNANMLNPLFNEIGIGRACTVNSSYNWYWTTTFGGRLL